MLTTYARAMGEWHANPYDPEVKRTGGYTYDHRDKDERLRQLEAEVQALRALVRSLEGMREGMR